MKKWGFVNIVFYFSVGLFKAKIVCSIRSIIGLL